MRNLLVSVVIPAFNEEETISNCLASVKKQDYKNLEIIVVDDGSTDRTAKIARSFGVKVIRNKKNLGLAKSLNKGIKMSKGEIIVTLHADCELVEKDWISKIVKPFKDPSVAGVTGNPFLYETKKLPKWKLINLYFSGAFASVKSKKLMQRDLFNNKCDAYRRKALEEVGLFNEKFKNAGEDIDLTHKIRKRGYKLLIHPDCHVIIRLSSHQDTFIKSLKKRIDYGKVIPYLLIKHFKELLKNKTWCKRSLPYIVSFFLLFLIPVSIWFAFPFFLLSFIVSLRIGMKVGFSIFPLALLLVSLYAITWNIGIIYGIFLIKKKVI